MSSKKHDFKQFQILKRDGVQDLDSGGSAVISNGKVKSITYENDFTIWFYRLDERGKVLGFSASNGANWQLSSANTWTNKDGKTIEGEFTIDSHGNCLILQEKQTLIYKKQGWRSLLDLDTVSSFVKDQFSKLDLNRDGILIESELDKAVQDDSFRDLESQCLTFLKLNFAELSRIGVLSRSNSLTKRLANIFKKDEGLKPEIIDFVSLLLKEESRYKPRFDYHSCLMKVLVLWVISAWDEDGDKALSIDEIEEARKTYRENALLSDLLKLMQANFEQISKDQKSISKDDIWQYFSSPRQEAIFLSQKTASLLTSVQKRATNLSNKEPTLYIPDSKESITPYAISQGFAPNCGFLAILASLASLNPLVIEKAIKRNQDGTYDVRFPGYAGKSIKVSTPNETELTLYVANSNYGIWPAVIEKAWREYCSTSLLARVFDKKPLLNTPMLKNSVTSLICAGKGWHLFGPVSIQRLKEIPRADFAQLIHKQTYQNRMPCFLGGIKDAKRKQRELAEKYKLYDNHAYGVIAYDHEAGVIELYNPWGSLEGQRLHQDLDKDNGKLKISVEDAYLLFGTIALVNLLDTCSS